MITEDKCQDCGHVQQPKEIFWTRHRDGKIVCINCLDSPPKSLQLLNEERKQLKNKSK